MTLKEFLKADMDMAFWIMNSTLADLSDADILNRPAPKANHIAWQLGHLIESERDMLDGICPGKAPPLPAGFAEMHSKAAAGRDGAEHFLTKQKYIDLFAALRDASKAALEAMPDDDLGKPAPEKMRSYAPTVASVFGLFASHPMMHVGQFSVVRRMLDKPLVM